MSEDPGRNRYANADAIAASRHRPIAIDLFSGVGGLSLGLEAAGFHVAADVEIEELIGRYAQYNFPLSAVLHGEGKGDIRNISGEDIRRVTGLFRDEICLVAGGPPCQGFSNAGKKQAGDPLNDLVLHFARVVLELRPMAFLMENVPGIQTTGSEKLAECMRRLRREYVVAEPTTLNAWDFGVPQMRRRVFITGVRKDLGVSPGHPCPTHVRAVTDQLTLLPAVPSVWDAISDIPEVDRHDVLISGDRIEYDKKPQSPYQHMMRDADNDVFGHAFARQWDSCICTNLRRTRHGPKLLETFSKLAFGKIDKTSGIRRLEPDGLSTTIRAGTTKARGSWSAPRPLHPYQNRVLTTRECARIQSFPDWFLFHPTKWHGNRMVGNAVPPLLAKAAGEAILSRLGIYVHPYEGPFLTRDEALVLADIEEAAESGLENRRVSQKVFSWSVSSKRSA